jgi:hypothetical protein
MGTAAIDADGMEWIDDVDDVTTDETDEAVDRMGGGCGCGCGCAECGAPGAAAIGAETTTELLGDVLVAPESWRAVGDAAPLDEAAAAAAAAAAAEGDRAPAPAVGERALDAVSEEEGGGMSMTVGSSSSSML